jgi:hypothetical protein
MNSILSDRVQSFRERSYFVVPAFLARAELGELRRVCDHVLQQVRAESSVKGHTSPSVSLVAATDHWTNEPSQIQPVLSFAASRRVCALLDGLASDVEERAPRLKKLDYYHEQTQHDWNGDWHRDSQFTERDQERERALVVGTTAVHLRVAFEPDDRLELVEGSHLRWDTDEELRIRKGAQRASADMPHAVRIALSPGDACVFHAWAIHRATYQRRPLRRTLDALYSFVRTCEGPANGWSTRSNS